MSRHVDEIRELLFDEPEFESEEDEIVVMKKGKKKKTKNEDKKKSTVETIVFRDPAKKRKVEKVSESIYISSTKDFCFVESRTTTTSNISNGRIRSGKSSF